MFVFFLRKNVSEDYFFFSCVFCWLKKTRLGTSISSSYSGHYRHNREDAFHTCLLHVAHTVSPPSESTRDQITNVDLPCPLAWIYAVPPHKFHTTLPMLSVHPVCPVQSWKNTVNTISECVYLAFTKSSSVGVPDLKSDDTFRGSKGHLDQEAVPTWPCGNRWPEPTTDSNFLCSPCSRDLCSCWPNAGHSPFVIWSFPDLRPSYYWGWMCP